MDAGRTCVSDGESLVEVHGVCDGVEPLQGDDCQGEDGELGGQHPQEPRHQAARRCLPLYSVLLELACNERDRQGQRDRERQRVRG